MSAIEKNTSSTPPGDVFVKIKTKNKKKHRRKGQRINHLVKYNTKP